MSDTSNPPLKATQSDKEHFKCTVCGEVKPRSEYYVFKVHTSGYKSECKDCSKKLSHETYKKYRDKKNAVGRIYKSTERGKEVARKALQNARERYPEKFEARKQATSAIREGLIPKLPCEECGNPKVEAHHYKGYEPEYALTIQWLCRPHHRDAHKFTLRSRGLA